MSDLQDLLGLVGDTNKEEATKLVLAIEKNITSLDSQISSQEGQKNEAITSRDAAKAKLNTFISQIGAGNIDGVEAAINDLKKNGKTDDISSREIIRLKEEVEKNLSESKTQSAKHDSEMLAIVLQKDIAVSLPEHNAKPEAAAYIVAAISKSAVFEEGSIKFKNQDGTTARIDGQDADVSAMIKQMRTKEEEAGSSMFFDLTPQQSGGKGGGKVDADDFEV